MSWLSQKKWLRLGSIQNQSWTSIELFLTSKIQRQSTLYLATNNKPKYNQVGKKLEAAEDVFLNRETHYLIFLLEQMHYKFCNAHIQPSYKGGKLGFWTQGSLPTRIWQGETHTWQYDKRVLICLKNDLKCTKTYARQKQETELETTREEKQFQKHLISNLA